jgi:hypothetical protein
LYLDFLDCRAEVVGVLDGLEVLDHAPDELEPVGDALERLDQLAPGGLDALLEILELGLLRRHDQPSVQAAVIGMESDKGRGSGSDESGEEVAHAGADVARLDAVEGREVEVGEEEGVGVGHGRGVGGAGGRRGARPRAEGAERGRGGQCGKEEAWSGAGEAGGEREAEEGGGAKEKEHGGVEDITTMTRSRWLAHHLLLFFLGPFLSFGPPPKYPHQNIPRRPELPPDARRRGGARQPPWLHDEWNGVDG